MKNVQLLSHLARIHTIASCLAESSRNLAGALASAATPDHEITADPDLLRSLSEFSLALPSYVALLDQLGSDPAAFGLAEEGDEGDEDAG